MAEPTGLRERKKQRTRTAISDAAITMFLERGFDNVSVSEIAAAAEVTKSTVFVYFPTKDELVLHRVADHIDEPARVVRERLPGKSPLDALADHFIASLAARDPITGLNDNPDVIAYGKLVFGTPVLTAARSRYQDRCEQLLGEALRETVPGQDPLRARLAACQISAVLFLLMRTNRERVADGTPADTLAVRARDDAATAFTMLRQGLSSFCG
ncbi:TetR/AcrR family transcriptional regulator [Streptomyces sp. NPDC001288]|uniref:TetR/AcrR family transcriptional regulator n=1 Tax=Streptomyces sp. NPDC001297 TaxID=3364559 RepID=UPI0036839B24